MEIIYKNIGETSLQALERFRESSSKQDERLSYAGRLDPMASGKLLILEGEENDQRKEFLRLDKVYEFSILFGVSTDTFDLLGLVEKVNDCSEITTDEIDEALKPFVGKMDMKYPPYSAQTVEVNGKMTPLWQLARSNQLEEIELPTKRVEIYSAECSEVEVVEKSYIISYITDYITNLDGDFRQKQVVDRWRGVLDSAEGSFTLAHCRVSGSSGLYVRRLAHEIGDKLGCPSLAFSIDRVRIGEY